jgi:hypothetical protein
MPDGGAFSPLLLRWQAFHVLQKLGCEVIRTLGEADFALAADCAAASLIPRACHLPLSSSSSASTPAKLTPLPFAVLSNDSDFFVMHNVRFVPLFGLTFAPGRVSATLYDNATVSDLIACRMRCGTL